jgi:predicted RNase H-like HicB family nuclease
MDFIEAFQAKFTKFVQKRNHKTSMKKEFKILIETAPEGGFWAICPEVPGANGQGETADEAKENLKEAVKLILEDRLADMTRGLSEKVIIDMIAIE